MKKATIIAFLLVALAPMMQVWALSTYYAKLTVSKATGSSGSGTVYVGTSQSSANSTYNDPATNPSVDNSGSSASVGFYVSAKPSFGSKFSGWYENAAGTGTAKSTTAQNYNYSIDAKDSKNSSSKRVSKTIYAKFDTNTDSYTLTLNNPEGLSSYTVTAPSGFPADLSQGGSATVYKGDQYTFKYNLSSDEYDFVSWKVNNNTVEDKNLTLIISETTQIELNLKVKVAVTATCKGEIGGTYKANGKLVSGTDELITEFGSVSVNLSEATPSAGYEFYGWYLLHSNGAKEYLSYYKTASAEKNENITVGAEFRPIPNPRITLEAPAAGSFTCQVDNGTPVSVDNENPYVDVNGRLTNTFTAVSVPDNTRPKWYAKGELGNRIFFAVGSPATKVFTEDVTVGVVFEPVNTALASAIADAQAGDGTAVLSADAEVQYGTSMTIPADVTINLNGHTLYVDGTLTVNGSISGGTISKCTKLIKQTGNDLKPFNPYGDLRYWKTTVSSGNAVLNNASNSKSHLAIYNAYGECADRKDITDTTPVAVQCSANPAKDGVNLPGKILKLYTAAPDLASLAYDNSTSYANITNSNSKMVFALQDLTISYVEDGTNNKNKKAGVIDCAGYEFKTSRGSGTSYNYEVKSGTLFAIINAKKGSVPQLTGSLAMFINCQEVSASFHSTANYADAIYLYDCSISSGVPTTQKTGTTSEWPVTGVHIYSGKYSFNSTGSHWKIYGGSYTKKPSDDNIGLNGHKFYQHMDDLWYLEPSQDLNVAKVGVNKFMDFESAFSHAIGMGSAKIELLRNATVNQRLVVPAEKSIEIEFDGSTLTSTADDGLFLNNGSLTMGDRLGRLSNSGLFAANGYLIENNNGGAVKIAYGVYNGIIKLNDGSLFTTHHGIFNGSVVTDVADPSEVADIRGGKFNSDVSSLLREGYEQRDGYVGFFPWALWKDGQVSGYTSYNFSAMELADMQLFKSSEPAKENYYANNSYSSWYRRAELKSALAPHLTHTIDFVLKFDRTVESGSITAIVRLPHKVPSINKEMALDATVSANDLYRAMSPIVQSYGYYQISYNELVTDGAYEEVICGIKDNEGDNRGTTCAIRLDLCTGSKKTDLSKLESLYQIFSRSFVFGAGDKAAMLQTASGAVPDENFFDTLAAAVASEATTGKTIKLCNDCNEQVTVTKACTIDTNGFAFIGEITLGEGYSVSFSDGKYVISMPDPADVLVEKVEVATIVEQVVSKEWLVANEISPDAEPEVIQAAVEEKLKEEDTNGNAKWENLVIGQKANEKAAVTAANGGTDTTATIEVSFEVPKDESTGEKIETGYTVKYAFDQVDTAGDVVENGAGEAKDEPTLDFASVETDTPTYFKMRAVLESNDDPEVKSEVEVEKTIGVLKVESDAEYTILAVPWQSLGTGDIKASELVHAASLSEDDELIVYNDDGSTTSWVVKDGKWTSPTEYTIGDGPAQQNETVDPSTKEIARGQGVWLKRSDTTKDIVLIGQPATDDEPVETPIAAATSEDEPTWNLVASPKMEDVDLQTAFTEEKGNTGDEIIVPTAGTPKHYTYKDNKWGYSGVVSTTTVRLPDGTSTQAVKFGHVTNDTKVPAGQGFWYLNKDSSNNEKKITW